MSYDPSKADRKLFVVHATTTTSTGPQTLQARVAASSPDSAIKRFLAVHPAADVKSGTHLFGGKDCPVGARCASWHAYAVID